MYKDFDLGWTHSSEALSALSAAANAMPIITTAVSTPSSIIQMEEIVSGISETIEISSIANLEEESAAALSMVDEVPLGTELISAATSGILVDADIPDMSEVVSGVATAVSGLCAAASLLSETFEFISNVCQAVNEKIEQITEIFIQSARLTFSKLDEIFERLAELLLQKCDRVRYIFRRRVEWAIYRCTTFLNIGDPKKITMQNTTCNRKKFIFHRRQGGKSDSDDNCCVTYIVVSC